MNLTQLVAAFGAYYKDGGQGLKNLITAIMLTGLTTDKYFRPIVTKDTRFEFAFASTSEVLQGFQDTFTAKGLADFQPETIVNYWMKINFPLNPNGLTESWLGFLGGLPEQDRSKWPIVRYAIEQLIMPKLEEDKELEATYHGVYVAPTAGTPNAASATMNGIKKIINDGVNAGKCEVISIPGGIPAVTDSPEDYVDYIEAYVREIPEHKRAKLKEIFVRLDRADQFKRGMRAKYNMNYSQVNDMLSLADYPNLQIVGLPSMSGSDKVWTTFGDNRVRIINTNNPGQFLRAKEDDYKVKIMCDWREGLGFPNLREVYTNDEDLS